MANARTGEVLAVRERGVFSPSLPVLASGLYTATALENSEWWCIDRRLNNNNLPRVWPLDAKAGVELTLPAGTRLLVCDGALDLGVDGVAHPGDARITSRVVSTVPETDTLALVFENNLEM